MNKSFVLLGLSGLFCLTSASAQLAHRYSFTTDGSDSVGTANGALAGGATIAGGVLTTTGNNADYYALPTTVGTGITGDFSIETFVTIANNPGNFSSLFSLSGPGNRNFFLLNPSRPNAGGNLSVNFQEKDGQVTEGPGVDDTEVDIRPSTTTPFAFGATEQDLTVTYVAATNIVTLYVGNAALASGSIASALSGTSFNLQTVTALGQNGINGGGPFPDPSINGSTDDFRVYAQALTAAQVTAIDAAGPNASNSAIAALIPEPSTWALSLFALASASVLLRRRVA